MDVHLRRLREYWRPVKALAEAEERLSTSEAWVVDLMRILRVPPHESYHRVRQPGEARCPCTTVEGIQVRMTLPTVTVMGCSTCKIEWLELERAA